MSESKAQYGSAEYTYGGDYELHPPGTFRAKVSSVENRAGEHGPCKLWTLLTEALNPDERRATIRYLTGCRFSPNAKITQFARACGLHPPENSQQASQFVSDMLIGRTLEIVVVHQERNGFLRDVIVAVAKDPGRGAKAAPPPPPPPTESEEDPFADPT